MVTKAEIKEAQDPETMTTVSPCYWAVDNQIRLQAGVFSLHDREYLLDPMECEAQKQAFKKGAGMGFTEIQVLKSIHGQIYGKYPKGVLYLFPTDGDVTDFSKARFNPLISKNPHSIGRFVQDTDNVGVKNIKGTILFLRGARSSQKIEGLKETSSKLKSIHVDRVVFDEKDEMKSTMIELAKERISSSHVKEIVYISTPTIPDYGIDKDYQDSTQNIWFIKCKKCGYETCLELEFPNCLGQRKDGSVFRKCGKCGAEIYPRDGYWKPQYPNRDIVGWWISQLNSIFVNPGDILNAFLNPPNGNLAEVYNSKLGMAYVAAENMLQTQDVYACCGNDAIAMNDRGPCAMGVDVGSMLHVVIGKMKSNHLYKTVYIGRVPEFSDLHDLAKKFKVKSAVIDMYPETRKVREFQEDEDYKVFGCRYQDQLKEGEKRDEEAGIVTVDRTEICDISHNLIAEEMIELPRRSKELEIYAKEMTSIAKVLEEKKETGVSVYRYRRLDADHYRHATNYFYLACQDIQFKTMPGGKAYQEDEANQSYDILRH